MQKSGLLVENVCPDCGSTACAQFLTLDGTEVHINCLDCNRVYAGKIVASGDLKVQRWREVGTFSRL